MPPKIRCLLAETLPHSPESFTQGLTLRRGRCYESTGIYGKSALLEIDLRSGVPLRRRELPDQFFAEGIAVLGEKLFQLTWREGVAFEYDSDFNLPRAPQPAIFPTGRGMGQVGGVRDCSQLGCLRHIGIRDTFITR